ncbi:hypothetical protein HDU79_011347 [Rhizoclosmatium sp. JEL0117]|nr:hypothetical protein HDU79_011347 [Rhizoclosmatium sp. JEL0117]
MTPFPTTGAPTRHKSTQSTPTSTNPNDNNCWDEGPAVHTLLALFTDLRKTESDDEEVGLRELLARFDRRRDLFGRRGGVEFEVSDEEEVRERRKGKKRRRKEGGGSSSSRGVEKRRKQQRVLAALQEQVSQQLREREIENGGDGEDGDGSGGGGGGEEEEEDETTRGTGRSSLTGGGLGGDGDSDSDSDEVDELEERPSVPSRPTIAGKHVKGYAMNGGKVGSGGGKLKRARSESGSSSSSGSGSGSSSSSSGSGSDSDSDSESEKEAAKLRMLLEQQKRLTASLANGGASIMNVVAPGKGAPPSAALLSKLAKPLKKSAAKPRPSAAAQPVKAEAGSSAGSTPISFGIVPKKPRARMWTRKEDYQLLRAVRMYGNAWDRVEASVDGRE